MPSKLLLIARSAPWSSLNPRELLDIALSGGAFELPVSILFVGDGVLQLLDHQQPALLEQKNLAANLQALPLFDIEQLYVSNTCLAERGLQESALAVEVEPINQQRWQTLIAEHQQVIVL